MLRGDAAICGQLVTSSTIIAEVFAHEPFDAVLLDLQHGEIEFPSAVHLLQALATTGVTPLVRLSWNDPAQIMKLLDAGAYGLICPMVNTRAECEAFVQAACYPPAGYRSYGPLRAHLQIGEGYAGWANDHVLKIAMIETAEAMQNLDAIMSTPGLDGVYIGPSDLSKSYGGPFAPDWQSGPVRHAIDEVLQAAAKHEVFGGIYVHSPEYGREMIELGFDFIVLQSEVVFIQRQAAAAFATLHAGSPADQDVAASNSNRLDPSPA
jgi:4-hydroxy-2-oxoheptanedioate aldolase